MVRALKSGAPFMRKLSLALCTAVAVAACQRDVAPAETQTPPEVRRDAVFVNGDFEDGGLTGWTVSTFQNRGITYPPASRSDLKLLAGGTNRTKVVTGPTESIIPAGLTSAASLRVPKYGQNAVVVNELGTGYNVNTLVQQFTVGPADVDPSDDKVHVRFALAPVLNSGGHGPADQPYFWVMLTNVTKNATLFGTFNFANQSGVPWQIQGTNYFTDWQSFDIAPGNVALAVGDTVRLEVIGAGCSQSGHWGEVYVDGFGPFLPGLQVAASAPQSANAGSNITYTLSYQNRGAGAANNTTVTFNLPVNTSFQSISAPGATCTTPAVGATTGQVVCNVGTVNPSASGSFTVTVQIAAGASGKISAGNYSVRADGVSALLGPLVETAVTANVQYADLRAQLDDTVAAVAWGQAYAFTVVVTNAGPTAANGATVTWNMPAQLASASWTCSGAGCGAASGTGSISQAVNLASGASVTFSVNGTLTAGAMSGSMTNLVAVSAPAGITDNDTTNNQDIDTNAIGTLRTVTFAKAGTGTGRVVTSPSAIDCAAGCSSASTSFIDGTVVSVTATATTGHTFSGWSGACAGTANPCTFTVSGDATLTAAFAPPSFTITASAGSGGSISPAGSTPVVQGGSQTFTITPATGRHIDDVRVDGVSVGAVTSYTFSNVTAPHTIAASFALDTFLIASSAGANGSISGSQTVAWGASATFAITPAANHHVADVLVDGVSVGAVSSYTFSNVTAPHTIAATFAIDTFLITSSAGANGSISGSQTVAWGASATFTLAPAANHHVADVLVDGVSVGAVSSYTFSSVTAPHTIAATFAIDTYAVTASAGPNGSVSPQGTQHVAHGSSLTVNIAAAANHHIADVLVDGASVGAVASYTFSNVTAAHALSASFAIDTFGVVGQADANGSVTCSSPVPYGGSSTCTIAPAPGYELVSLVDGPTPVSATNGSYVATNVTGARTVTASFKRSNGGACAAAGECASGTCADGFCCNAACNGQCEACDVAGSEGTCSPVAGAPHGSRTSCDSDGTVCGGTCDGTARNACSYPGAAQSCRSASCATGVATLAAACDGQGHCPAVQTESCAPYLCGATACAGNCAADSDCAAGNWCSGGVCEPKKLPGLACGADNQCGSGFCTDGVCCDVACGGQCEACDVAGSVGTCSPVAGAPHAGRAPCTTDEGVCGGTCNGTLRDSCEYPTASTQCRAPSCTAGVATLGASCNGAGMCPAEQQVACAPFVCGANACLGDCQADSDCEAGNWCAAGICVPTKEPGASCAANNQCGSGFCTDGVCCNAACNGQCQACDVAGKVGTCSPVVGAPHGSRSACESDGTACGGQCNGEDVTACAYPQAECRAASCSGGVAVMAATCSAGHCPAKQEQACGAFACGASACNGGCSADADCAAGNWCSAGVCVAKRPPAASCSASNQCGSGSCVDGVCCNTACDGQCEACDVAGSVGTCTAVSGAPHGARQDCASDGTMCGGACDGVRRDACTYAGGEVQCVAASCSSGRETQASACNGAGRCAQPVTALCGTYACGDTACRTNCSSDAECGADGFCAGGQCLAKGDKSQWRVQGGVGLGCQASGGDLGVLGLALAVLALLRRRRAVGVAAAVLVSATAAQAQDVSRTFLLERFQPQAGAGDVLGVQSAAVSPHLMPQILVYASYADVPLRAVTVTDEGVRQTLAASQTTMTVSGAIGLFNRVEVGLAVPVVITQAVGAGVVDPGLSAGGSQVALADLRVQAKVRLLDVGPFSFAASLPVTLPTAGGAAYAGYAGPTATPTVIGQWNGPRRSAVLLDLGVAIRQQQQLLNLTVGSAFTWAVAGKIDLVPKYDVSAMASVGGELGFAGAGAVQAPLEAIVAVRWMPIKGLALTLGAGPGLSPGYGTPRFRVVASLGWVPSDDAESRPGVVVPAQVAPPPAAPEPAPAAAPVAIEEPAPEPVVAADRVE